MENDETIELPSDTLLILNQFLKEKAERETLEESLSSRDAGTIQFNAFEENWQLSQFWYNQSTKDKLARVCQCLSSTLKSIKIGLLSCPSLYDTMKTANPNSEIYLFEFDQRFSVFDNFVHYDYNRGTEVDYLSEYKQFFDIIVADPPFLAEECIEKLSTIIRNISKSGGKVILCSGQTVCEWAEKYLNLSKCQFQPEHERNLGNEFAAYANFDLDQLIH